MLFQNVICRSCVTRKKKVAISFIFRAFVNTLSPEPLDRITRDFGDRHLAGTTNNHLFWRITLVLTHKIEITEV